MNIFTSVNVTISPFACVYEVGLQPAVAEFALYLFAKFSAIGNGGLWITASLTRSVIFNFVSARSRLGAPVQTVARIHPNDEIVVKRLALVALIVADYDEAINGFRDTLGFALVEVANLGGGKRWVVMRAGDGADLLLAKAENAEQRVLVGQQFAGRVGFFLYTDDFRRDHAAMTAKGVTFLEAPRDEPYGRVAVFEDLYGNKWDLIAPARERS